MSGKPPPRPLGQTWSGMVTGDELARLWRAGALLMSFSQYDTAPSGRPGKHYVYATMTAKGLRPTRGGGSRQ